MTTTVRRKLAILAVALIGYAIFCFVLSMGVRTVLGPDAQLLLIPFTTIGGLFVGLWAGTR